MNAIETRRAVACATERKAARKVGAGTAVRLRDLAGDVRRIGCGYRADPESIAIEKDAVAKNLAQLAREVER